MADRRTVAAGVLGYAAMVGSVGVFGSAAVTGCVAMAGCAAPAVALTQTAAPAGDVDFESLWQATLDTFREFSYRPDRLDRRAGVITSEPEVGKQAWEVWRKDVPGGYGLLESSLHTVRRDVEVNITHTGPYSYEVDVQVDKYRWSFPERQTTAAVAAAAAFTDRLPISTGQRVTLEAEAQQVQWVPLGRDAKLEQQILASILKKSPAGVRATTVRAADLAVDPQVQRTQVGQEVRELIRSDDATTQPEAGEERIRPDGQADPDADAVVPLEP